MANPGTAPNYTGGLTTGYITTSVASGSTPGATWANHTHTLPVTSGGWLSQNNPLVTQETAQLMIDQAIENLKKEIREAGIKWLLTR